MTKLPSDAFQRILMVKQHISVYECSGRTDKTMGGIKENADVRNVNPSLLYTKYVSKTEDVKK